MFVSSLNSSFQGTSHGTKINNSNSIICCKRVLLISPFKSGFQEFENCPFLIIKQKLTNLVPLFAMRKHFPCVITRKKVLFRQSQFLSYYNHFCEKSWKLTIFRFGSISTEKIIHFSMPWTKVVEKPFFLSYEQKNEISSLFLFSLSWFLLLYIHIYVLCF